MRNFRTLDLAVAFYRLSHALRLESHLKEQLNRAAASIALNLAEGRGRASVADQKRFFTMAHASLRECQAILTLGQCQNTAAWKTLDALAAHLYRLIKSMG